MGSPWRRSRSLDDPGWIDPEPNQSAAQAIGFPGTRREDAGTYGVEVALGHDRHLFPKPPLRQRGRAAVDRHDNLSTAGRQVDPGGCTEIRCLVGTPRREQHPADGECQKALHSKTNPVLRFVEGLR